jgi:branched-chain amino acid transport system permease protein
MNLIDLVMANTVHGIILGCIYALIAMGMNLIYGVLGAKNLAHGDFAMLGMFTTYWLVTLYNINPFLTIPIVFVIFLPIGLLFSKYIISKTIGDMMGSIIVTFGLSSVIMNMARIIWGADFRSTGVPFITFSFGPVSVGSHYLLAFVITIIITILLHLFLTRTKIGTAIRAVGQDAEAASSLGMHVSRLRMLSTSIAIGLAGACGAILSLLYYVQPYVGVTITLTALIMCVVGGLGSVKGAFIGGLIIGLVQNLSSIIIPFGMTPVAGFIIFVLILIFKPKGLFGGG